MQSRFEDVSDAGLVLAIARYEQGALAEAYHRHAGSVLALARRLVFQRAVAEEIVQEVFLRLWNDPTRFDPERAGLRSFLLLDTHGRAVDVLRSDSSRRLREEREARHAATLGYGLDLEAGDLFISEQVRAAVATLPAVERQVIEVAYFGGYTYREVAARLGMPEGTVKSRIRAGLRRLHSSLAGARAEMGRR